MTFNERVFFVVRLIPEGRVTTYGMIAKFVGAPKAARMVGWAMNRSHEQQEYIPAHRVVNRNGLLTGKAHFKGESMAARLEREGICIKENKIQQLDSLLWDPFNEIEIVPKAFYDDLNL
ncbi:MGMT family protein [Halosquirtibacter xylanolyticus]|uniref:MGMT family protein n=1 Tax=Halosquirtibacter xylanolyticus TaxID=3374599 RepID=UPI003747AFD1|nr:MGMT family protein [Prolixibacteraceae bacterium]